MDELKIITYLGILLLIVGVFSEYKGEYYEYIEKNEKKSVLLEIVGGLYIAIGFLALLLGLAGQTIMTTIPI